jgi:hypothetical protein
MSVSLAAGAAPIFLDGPYINTECLNAGGLSVSSGDAFKHRVFDFVRDTQWTTQGEDTDGVSSTYDAKLFRGSTQTPQTINFIALLNINLKRFKVEYRLGGGAFAVVPGLDYTGADFTGTDLLVALAADIDADELLLTATHTQTANEEKAVGGFIVGQVLSQPSRAMASDDQAPQDTILTVVLGDGSIDDTAMLRGDDGFSFERSSLSWVGVPRADVDDLNALRGRGFVYVAEPGDRQQDVFYCRFKPGSVRLSRTTPDRTRDAWNFSADLEELGGA